MPFTILLILFVVVIVVSASFIMSYYTVNSVLERLFSGQFSLNVRTATIGQLQGHTSVEHGVWSQPQPQPVLPLHGGVYTCIYECQHFTF